MILLWPPVPRRACNKSWTCWSTWTASSSSMRLPFRLPCIRLPSFPDCEWSLCHWTMTVSMWSSCDASLPCIDAKAPPPSYSGACTIQFLCSTIPPVYVSQVVCTCANETPRHVWKLTRCFLPESHLSTIDVCNEVVSIAREFDILVLTEDVYNTLSYDPANGPPQRLFAYDRRTDAAYRGNVISNGTFSKILAPGARVGWLEMPPRALRAMHPSGVMGGGAANNYTSGVVTTALELNLVNRVFDDNIKVYTVIWRRTKVVRANSIWCSFTTQERMQMAVSVLREKLPASCQFRTPSGGYFIWITMPEHIDGVLMNQYIRDHHKVFGISGNVFAVDRLSYRNCVRLAISYYQMEHLEPAIRRFCDGVCAYFARNPAAWQCFGSFW